MHNERRSTYKDKGLKGTVVNRALPTLNGGSLRQSVKRTKTRL